MASFGVSATLVLSCFEESVPRTYDSVYDMLGDQRVHALDLDGMESLFEFLHYSAMAGMLAETSPNTFVLTCQGREYIHNGRK